MNKEENVFNTWKKETRHKCCFYNDQNCSERIIKAHSIQNNRILNHLSENGYVIMIDANSLDLQMKPIGRKKATTFTGFCENHDNILFKSIEEHDYKKGNKEQEFLFSYRALAKEYNAKKSSKNFVARVLEYIRNKDYLNLESLLSLNFINKEKIERFKNIYEQMFMGYSDAINRYEKYRISMARNISNQRFHSIRTDVIEFPWESKIAVSSLINIEYDLNGIQINRIRDPKAIISPCFLTVFPQNNKTFTLLSYFNNRKNDYEFIRKQIKSKDIDEQKYILSNLIINYCENVVLAPDLWDSYSKEQQKEYLNIFRSTIYEKGHLSNKKIINLYKIC